jgi:hypothetical protein
MQPIGYIWVTGAIDFTGGKARNGRVANSGHA